jgi:hypothetical protein
MNTAYATEDGEPKRRFGDWTDAVCRHCLAASSKFMSQEPFAAYFSHRRIGRIDLRQFGASARAARGVADITRRSHD